MLMLMSGRISIRISIFPPTFIWRMCTAGCARQPRGHRILNSQSWHNNQEADSTISALAPISLSISLVPNCFSRIPVFVQSFSFRLGQDSQLSDSPGEHMGISSFLCFVAWHVCSRSAQHPQAKPMRPHHCALSRRLTHHP